MSSIIICRASELIETVLREKPAAVVSIEHPGVRAGDKGSAPRLSEHPQTQDVPQLVLSFWDSEQAVANGPDEAQVKKGLEFALAHINEGAVIIHCHAGKARSAALALGVLAQSYPEKSENELVDMLLDIRPQAAPNIIVVRMVDALTKREGKLTQAVLDNPILSAQRAQAEHNRQEMLKRDPALLKKLHPEKFFKP